MPGPPVHLSREELYDLVWSEPMSTVAPKLGMSDRGVAKICERLKVPRPPRGYWQKKMAGQKVRRFPLRALPDGARTPSIARIAPGHERAPVSQAVVEAKRSEARPENAIVVPTKVGRYHPLVRATRAAVRARRSTAARPRDARQAVQGLDVEVTKDSEVRALGIMHALIKGLEKRGISVKVDASTDSTLAVLDEAAVKIRLTERRRRIELPPTPKELADEKRYGWRPFKRYEYQSTGKLVLAIDEWIDAPRKSWADGKKQRVEDCLNDFVVGLRAVAEAKRRADIERRERAARREEERRIKEAIRAREEAERRRWDDLRRRAAAWEEHRRIVRYIRALRRRLEHAPDELKAAARPWLEWAEARIGDSDPFHDVSSIFAERALEPVEPYWSGPPS